jgi:hypothetical protein
MDVTKIFPEKILVSLDVYNKRYNTIKKRIKGVPTFKIDK